MTKIRWNLFAVGECEDDEVFTAVLPGETERRLYIKRKCPACGEVMWIREGLNVCDTCIP